MLAAPNQGLDDKLSDLDMLVNPGGMERSTEEFEAEKHDTSPFPLKGNIGEGDAVAESFGQAVDGKGRELICADERTQLECAAAG